MNTSQSTVIENAVVCLPVFHKSGINAAGQPWASIGVAVQALIGGQPRYKTFTVSSKSQLTGIVSSLVVGSVITIVYKHEWSKKIEPPTTPGGEPKAYESTYVQEIHIVPGFGVGQQPQQQYPAAPPQQPWTQQPPQQPYQQQPYQQQPPQYPAAPPQQPWTQQPPQQPPFYPSTPQPHTGAQQTAPPQTHTAPAAPLQQAPPTPVGFKHPLAPATQHTIQGQPSDDDLPF